LCPAPVEYRIHIDGHLAPDWSGWFENMAVQCRPDGTTILLGPVRDQAALHGLLIKVRDLGLPLISVNQVGLGAGEGSAQAGQPFEADA
jgi:hypothetical protein